AVVGEDQQLNYQELNQQANKLAHHLASLDVGPEVVVGILLERSVEMVVGLLGILKAGGVCLPLDPSYPKERLAFLMADAGVKVLLTQEQLAGRLAEHRAGSVCVEAGGEFPAAGSAQNAARRAAAQNLAYVIYTSGSTGRPKGV